MRGMATMTHITTKRRDCNLPYSLPEVSSYGCAKDDAMHVRSCKEIDADNNYAVDRPASHQPAQAFCRNQVAAVAKKKCCSRGDSGKDETNGISCPSATRSRSGRSPRQ